MILLVLAVTEDIQALGADLRALGGEQIGEHPVAKSIIRIDPAPLAARFGLLPLRDIAKPITDVIDPRVAADRVLAVSSRTSRLGIWVTAQRRRGSFCSEGCFASWTRSFVSPVSARTQVTFVCFSVRGLTIFIYFVPPLSDKLKLSKQTNHEQVDIL